MAESIAVQLDKILGEYMDQVDDVVRKDTTSTAREASKELRSVSPKKSGEYASGWTSKQLGDKTAVTYNGKMPGLTHLLEKGHVIRNKKGDYGRAPAHPHIAPVAAQMEQKFIEKIERDLS